MRGPTQERNHSNAQIVRSASQEQVSWSVMMKGLTKILLAKYVTKQVFWKKSKGNQYEYRKFDYLCVNLQEKIQQFFAHTLSTRPPTLLNLHLTKAVSVHFSFILLSIRSAYNYMYLWGTGHILGMVLQIVHKPSRSRYWDNSDKLGNFFGGGMIPKIGGKSWKQK